MTFLFAKQRLWINHFALGKNAKVWHFSHILEVCKIGENCIIGQHVMIGMDVKIGNYCKIQNNVSLLQGGGFGR